VGKFSDGSACVEECSPGRYSDGNACVEECSPGRFSDGGACVAQCPTGRLSDGGACVEQCPAGRFSDGLKCTDVLRSSLARTSEGSPPVGSGRILFGIAVRLEGAAREKHLAAGAGVIVPAQAVSVGDPCVCVEDPAGGPPLCTGG
jgi:hypothetical protein